MNRSLHSCHGVFWKFPIISSNDYETYMLLFAREALLISIRDRKIRISDPFLFAIKKHVDSKHIFQTHMIILPEINQCNKCHDEAINRKTSQGRGIQEPEEPENRGIGYHEGGHKSDGQDAEVTGLEFPSGLEKVIEASQEHQGHCHDEGEICCCFTGNPKEQTTCDGTTTAREAWPQGQALEKTDLESLLHGNTVHIFYREMASHFFCKNHESPTQDKPYNDGERPEEGMLDKAMENKSQQACGEHSNSEIQERGSLGSEPMMGIQNKSEFLMIHNQYRENSA